MLTLASLNVSKQWIANSEGLGADVVVDYRECGEGGLVG